MSALRMTQLVTDGRPAPSTGEGRAFVLLLGLAAIVVGMAGCDGQGGNGVEASEADATPYRPLMTYLPPPASDRIDYRDHKLTFYDLTGGGRWMVKRADTPTAYPVGPEHTLPESVKPDDTIVFYTRPGGQKSRAITLAQIQAARPGHESQQR